jgi:hypothetical protein
MNPNADRFKNRHKKNVHELLDITEKELVQHITKSPGFVRRSQDARARAMLFVDCFSVLSGLFLL